MKKWRFSLQFTKRGWGIPFSFRWWNVCSMYSYTFHFFCFMLRIDHSPKKGF